MKKTLLLLSVLTLSTSLMAQQFFAGAFVKPQSAWIINNDDFDSDEFDLDIPFTWAYGIQGGYMFTNAFGLETQLIFSAQGQDYILADGEEKVSIENKYINIPLLVRLRGGGEKAGFLLHFGPQIGLLTSSNVVSESFPDLNEDWSDYYKNTTFSLVLGLGANIMLTDYLSLDLMVKVDGGFTEIETELGKAELYDYNENGRAMSLNAVAGFSVGVNYIFGSTGGSQ